VHALRDGVDRGDRHPIRADDRGVVAEPAREPIAARAKSPFDRTDQFELAHGYSLTG
jgi:hypothetical protein